MKTPIVSFLRRLPRALFMIFIGGLTWPATAHEVWIEDAPDGRLFVRFAEYGDKYEQSPGALDALTLPYAWTPPAAGKPVEAQAAPENPANRAEREVREGTVETFAVEKKADGFLLAGASPDRAAQIETGFTVMGNPGDAEKPARKPYFYARWHPAGAGAAQPALNFDLVPTGTAGKVRVYFRGQPLAGAKVKLYPPAEAEQELVSDAEGFVQFMAVKPGLYLLAGARQRETTPGFFGGKPYDVVSHNCSLSWRQP